MSTKKLYEGYDPGVRIFLLLSLCLHIGIVGFLVFLGPSLSWVSARKRPYRRPVIVQVVELPPGYKAPQSKKGPETRIKRYADRTSVVEKETIPEATGIKIPAAIAAPPSGKGSQTAGSGQRPEKRVSGRPTSSAKAEEGLDAAEETGAAGGIKVAGPAKKPRPEASASSAGRDGITGGAAAAAPAGRPNLLLPEKKVAELERQYSSAPHKGERSKTLQLNTSELKYQRYLVDLKNRIQLYWEYPGVAVRNGWEGKLNIDFTIDKDGTIKILKLSRSSRYPVLDDAAMTALKLAAPFPAFPGDFDIQEIKIHGQFVYNLITIGPR